MRGRFDCHRTPHAPPIALADANVGDGVPSATPWSQDVFDSRGLSARKAAGGASLSAVVEAGAQSVGS
jgi:hypothetical protein